MINNEFKELLIGCKIFNIKRTCDLVLFSLISPKNSEISLHVQCFFRIFELNKLIISGNDMFREGKTQNLDEFIWSNPGTSLFDECIIKHKNKLLSSSIKTIEIYNNDLRIYMHNNLVIEILIDTTEYEEKYRVFLSDNLNSHIIVYSSGNSEV